MAKQWLLALLISSLLSACGFHLRGSYSIPEQFSTVYLQPVDPYAGLTRAVKKHLIDRGVELANTVSDDTPTIVLGKDTLERSNLSLFADGQVAEYLLVYKVEVQIVQPNQPLTKLKLQVQRDYLDDPRQALAKKRERELLLQEMRQQIADQLLLKLASL